MSGLRILIAGTLPLAAPWNGADKQFARLLAEHDHENTYVVQTSREEQFTRREGLSPVRTRWAPELPTAAARVASAAFVARHARNAHLIHLVATLHHPSRVATRGLAAWAHAARRPILHTIPSLGDGTPDRSRLPSDDVVVVSEHSRRLLLAAGVRSVHRIDPPLSPIIVDPAAITATRARFGLGSRAVLCAVHFGSENGLAELIQAFARLAPAYPDADLVLACRHHPWQDPAREADQVRAAAAAAGIGERVRLVGRVADMRALIAACAVTVLVPRRLDAKMDLPLVVLESLALGRPVVIGDRPPLAEALFDGGVCVPPGDVASLHAALAGLLGNDDLRLRLGRAGGDAVARRCAPERTAATYRSIYEQTLAREEISCRP
jgi:glycosyltransferase involved in cell wall biosynthesis